MRLNRSGMTHLIASLGITGGILLLSLTHFPDFPDTVRNSLPVVIGCYWCTITLLPKPLPKVISDRKQEILPILLSCYCVAIATIAMFRIEYSRSVLALGASITFIWLLGFFYFQARYQKVSLSVITNFNLKDLQKYSFLQLKPVEHPYSISDVEDGLVVNLHKPMSNEQEKFLADCSISNVPVIHSETIKERLERKVPTTHLSENSIGTLLPSQTYMISKSVIERLFIITILPAVVVVCTIIAALIRTSSKGKILFSQERIGYKNKRFTIYKFRTMEEAYGGDSRLFATEEEHRINKLGNLLRKSRLDELPQLWNVLIGDMSLIGPRPERPELVQEYEKKIPFYNFRHVVRPGISGWAQVEQGYTDTTDMTRHKLGYDLYYIKNLSFVLDMKIAVKTIGIMLTGLGAK
ncbi:sugar transferase [Vibrio sp. JC009]|uniref:sugar transferase n=1 Tax=Vibrio sp. JC009 TaxID=2912314 RepID=UPI0023B1A35C|nr:sugar transferase [Vibrio sp. JC009]WED22039.1 sugar transferase [Vibrio sp. JC009]